MTPIAVAAAAVVVLGAVLGTGARSARVATLGLTMALLFSPFVADPLPDTLALATRLVGGTLAGYLLLVTSRRAVAPVGSPLGSLALLAAAGAAAVAGFQPSILGLARQGPEEAMAAGLACLILALPAVVAARDTFRLGASLVVALTGILLVRRDSGIKEVTDLKGKKVSYPARTALAATMMPQYFLHTHGVDINRDIENLYVGSQESSIMNVYLGNVAAGATWPLPWEAFQKEHPDMARDLELKWETEPLINNGVVAKDDVPPALAQRVAQLLDTLHTTAEGRAILARMPLSRFELADDNRYRVIEDFLRTFNKEVRPLDELQR